MRTNQQHFFFKGSQMTRITVQLTVRPSENNFRNCSDDTSSEGTKNDLPLNLRMVHS